MSDRARGGAGARARGAARRAAGRGAERSRARTARGRARGAPWSCFAERVADYRRDGAPRARRRTWPRRSPRPARERGARAAGRPRRPARRLAPGGVELLRRRRPLPRASSTPLDGVLTGCALAIAETGTIVLDARPRPGPPRAHARARLPPLRGGGEQIVASVPEAVARLHAAAREGRPITFISGPSATSDIELRRVDGVHGPRTLTVLIAEAG